MNMNVPDKYFLEEALASIRALGISATWTAPRDEIGDGQVHLEVHGQVLLYTADIKPRIVSSDQLNAIYFRANNPRDILLVTDQLTTTQALHCKKIGLQFVDHAGNAYIEAPGVLIFTSGLRNEKVVTKHTRVTMMTAAMVRTVFVLLADPKYVNKPYREIAVAAQVSLGAVAQTFEMLEARQYLVARKESRQLQSIRQLIIEWAAAYLHRVRPKLATKRFEAPDGFAQNWRPAIDVSAWGGEVAADIATKNLRPEHFTIYLDESDERALSEIVKRHRLRRANDGNLEIVQAFWNLGLVENHAERVPLHLVYADLTMTLDPRNLEVAATILDLAEEDARR